MIRRRGLSLPRPAEVPALLALVEPDLGSGVKGLIGAASTDAQGLVDAAIAHGLGPRLAAAVAAGTLTLPEADRRRLSRRMAMRLARSRALRAELPALGRLVAGACGESGICLKGPAIADRLYPDPAMRPFVDLDLLVPRERLADAASSLGAAGWTEDVEFTAGFAARHGHELQLRRRRGGIWLSCELHWRIGDDPVCAALDHARLARAAAPLPSCTGVLAPAAADELVVLCVHFLSDRERRLSWIDDISRAAGAADETDWRASFELADELSLSWALHRGLDYAASYLGLRRARPLPPGPAPPFGPMRAVEELDMRASVHVGRLARMSWRERAGYLRAVLLPTGEGLAGTAGRDGASLPLAWARHLRSVIAGLLPRR